MCHEDEPQDGGGEEAHLPPGGDEQHLLQVQQQADHEVQVGHEEDEEILSREKMQESCCRSEGEMCGHGEASGRKA